MEEKNKYLDDTKKIDTLVEVEYLVKILIPVIILFCGIFGYFTGVVSEEVSEKLLLAGGVGTGLTTKK